MYQAAVAGAWQTTPLVVDGVMYLTQRPNDVIALDAKTGRVFWIYRHPLPPNQIVCCGVEQSRRRDARRHALHGHARRASGGDRREERPAAVEHEGGRQQGRLLADARAARRQGQDHRRRRRRRVRHPRVRRGLRRAQRQGSVALLHHPGARRTGRRHVEEVSAGPGQLLRLRRLEARRRLGVGDRVLRSGARISPTGASATPAPTGTTNSVPATTSTPTRSSRSTPTPAA